MNFYKNLDNKKKQLFKLVIYTLVLVIAIITLNVTSKNDEVLITPKKEESEEITDLEDLKLKLINSNYEYEYIVNINEQKYIYNGKKINDMDIGYKETNDNIIKYKKVDGTSYKLDVYGNEEIIDLYSDYENSTFLNVEKLIRFLAIYSYQTIDEDIFYYQYIFDYDSMETTLKMYVDDNMITKILIENPSIMYELTFRIIKQ